MPKFDFDYFVVGGGSGGMRSARVAADHGARVGIAERGHWGGTCVNAGCVPKKILAIAAHFATDMREAAGFGWDEVSPKHDWQRLIKRKDQEVGRLNAIYRRMLEERGCTLFEQHATLLDAHTLCMGERRVTADKILLAVGGWPILDGAPGVEEHASTSNDVFGLPEMPSSLLIVGGGYVGVEFASIFHGLGAHVTVACRSDFLLRGFDEDLGRHLAAQMRASGIDVRLQTQVLGIAKRGGRLAAALSDGDTLSADCAIYAIGRRPNTGSLGLEAAGVACDEEGAIVVDASYRTNLPNVFAVGDVTEGPNLTPTAIAEGHLVADLLFGDTSRVPRYRNVPTAVFSDPPIGAVGLSELSARKQSGNVDVFRREFRPLRHAMSGRSQTTLQKLVVDRATGRLLGCHMIGMDAPEIIQGFAVAMNCGATKEQLDRTIGVHPTSAEEFVSMSPSR